VQPGGVQPFVADDDQDRPGADRVNGHAPAAAPRHCLAQRAVADLVGHALREGQPRSGQRGEVVRVYAPGVLPDDQAIPAGHGRAGNPGHLLLKRAHLREQSVFNHLRTSPLAR
jgi:hypothetical protein